MRLSGAKAMTRLLILIAVAFVVVAVAIAWMQRTYLPGAPLTYIFFEQTFVLKVLAIVVVVLMGVGTLGGIKRDVTCVRKAAILSVALGVLGAVYGEYNTHFGWLIDNVITFATLAPMRLESLGILALGLFSALPGLVILHLKGGVHRG